MVTLRLLFISYAVLILVNGIPGIARAFSLGELQLLSKPGQAFQAAAAIRLGKSEDITSVEMGSISDYGILNLPYVDVLDSITVQLKRQGGKPFVWFDATVPIQEDDFYVLLRVSSNRHTYFPFFRVHLPVSLRDQGESVEPEVVGVMENSGGRGTVALEKGVGVHQKAAGLVPSIENIEDIGGAGGVEVAVSSKTIGLMTEVEGTGVVGETKVSANPGVVGLMVGMEDTLGNTSLPVPSPRVEAAVAEEYRSEVAKSEVAKSGAEVEDAGLLVAKSGAEVEDAGLLVGSVPAAQPSMGRSIEKLGKVDGTEGQRKTALQTYVRQAVVEKSLSLADTSKEVVSSSSSAKTVEPSVHEEGVFPETKPAKKNVDTKWRGRTDNTPTVYKKSIKKSRVYGPVLDRENLTEIARQFHPKSVATIFQTLVAIWQRNPDHFIRNNMNGLRAGALLVIPTPKEMAQVNNRDARRLRLSHAVAWKKNLGEGSREPLRGMAQEDVSDLPAAFFPSSPAQPSSAVLTPIVRDEGPTEEVKLPLIKFPARFQAIPPIKEQPIKEQPREEDSDLMAVLKQLKQIARILENNQKQREWLEKRVFSLEAFNRDWNLLKKRVDSLEKAGKGEQSGALSVGSSVAAVSGEAEVFWEGISVVGFGLFGGGLLLWLGRRWHRTDQWNNLMALLSATAKKDPQLLRDALKQTEPVFDQEFVPAVDNRELDGVSPQAQKRTLAGNIREKASKLESTMRRET